MHFHLGFELCFLHLSIQKPGRGSEQALILVTHNVANARRQARLQLGVLNHLKLFAAQILFKKRAIATFYIQIVAPFSINRCTDRDAPELAALPYQVIRIMDRRPDLRGKDIRREVMALARVFQLHESRLAHLLRDLTLKALHGQAVAASLGHHLLSLGKLGIGAGLRLHLLGEVVGAMPLVSFLPIGERWL